MGDTTYNNFRPGYMEKGEPLGKTRKQVMLNADNLQINVAGVSYLELSSDSTTATDRTFIIVQSTLVGHELEIVFVSGSSTTAQLADSGTVKLVSAWLPSQYDSLSLMWNGSYWIEMGRSSASGSTDIPLADGSILVGNASGLAAAVAMSGDATIANTGAVTIANLAVTTAKIAAANVTLAKLASGIAPSHVVKYAGQHTTVGGAAAEAITVTGLAATDLVFVQMKDDGTGNVTIVNAVPTTNTLTVTFSADPGNDAVIYYQALRAAS